MSRPRRPSVSNALAERIDEAVAAVDNARVELARAVADRVVLRELRQAHARVTHAYDEADALLREATALAKPRSYGEWSLWRRRLSSLDTARQGHLFAELDTSGVMPSGTIRAIDTGMSGPDIGELQHGRSRPPGTPPTYGLDLEGVLLAVPGASSPAAEPGGRRIVEPLAPVAVLQLPIPEHAPSPPEAA